MNNEQRHAIELFLRAQTGADSVVVESVKLLSGGAIQENWQLTVSFRGGSHEGVLECVLRSDAPSGVAVSHSRAEEFALLQAAFVAGVTVPEPLWLGNASVFGRDFFIMRKAAGTAAGFRLVKDTSLGGDRELLVRRIGAEMAKLHTIMPTRSDVSFLP